MAIEARVDLDTGNALGELEALTDAIREAAQSFAEIGRAAIRADGPIESLHGTLREISRELAATRAATERTAASLGGMGAGAGRAGRDVAGLANHFEKLQQAGNGVATVGAAMVAGITIPIVALAKEAVSAEMTLEGLGLGMTAVMHDATKAAAEIEKLKEVAELPGLGMEEAIQGSIALQSAKMSAEQARASIEAVGNAVATVGGGKDDLSAVNKQFVQMLGLNRVLAEDFNVIRARIPQAGAAIEAAFGTQSLDAIRKAGIGAKEFIGGLTVELAKLPPVGDSLRNQFETAGDVIKDTLATIGKDLAPLVGKILGHVVVVVRQIGDAWREASPAVKAFIVGTAGVAAAIGPLVAAAGAMMIFVGSVGSAVATLAALPAALGTSWAVVGGIAASLAGWAVVVAAAGAVVWSFRDEIIATFKRIWSEVKPAFDGMVKALQPFIEAVKVVGTVVVGVVFGVLLTAWEALKVAIGLAVQYAVVYLNSLFAGIRILAEVTTWVAGQVVAGFNALWSGVVAIFNGLVAALAAVGKAVLAVVDFFMPLIQVAAVVVGLFVVPVVAALWVLWQGVKLVFEAIGQIWEDTLREIDDLVAGWHKLVAGAEWVSEAVGAFFSGMWGTLLEMLSNAAAQLSAGWTRLMDLIPNALSQAVDTAMGYWTAFTEGLSGLFAGAMSWITEYITNLPWVQRIMSVLSGVIDGIQEKVREWTAAGRALVDSLVKGIIQSAAKIPLVGTQIANQLAAWFGENPIVVPVEVKGPKRKGLSLAERAAAAFAGANVRTPAAAGKSGAGRTRKSAEETALDASKASAEGFARALREAREAGQDTAGAIAGVRAEMDRVRALSATTAALENQRADILASLDSALFVDLEARAKAVAEAMERTRIGTAEHTRLLVRQAAIEAEITAEAGRRGVQTTRGADTLRMIEELREKAASDVADEAGRTLAYYEDQLRAGADVTDLSARLATQMAEVTRQLAQQPDPTSATAASLRDVRDSLSAAVSGLTSMSLVGEELLERVGEMPEELRRSSEEGRQLEEYWAAATKLMADAQLSPELRRQAKAFRDTIDGALGELTPDAITPGLEVITWEDFGKRIAEGLKGALRGGAAPAAGRGGYQRLMGRTEAEAKPDSDVSAGSRGLFDAFRTVALAAADEIGFIMGTAQKPVDAAGHTISAAGRAFLLASYTADAFGASVQEVATDVAGFGRTLVGQIASIANPMALFRQSASMASDVFGQLVGALNPLTVLADAFSGIMQGIAPAMEAFKEPIALLGRVVSAVVAPIVERLAPVFERLIPVVAVVARILGVLFEALMPIIEALVPIVEAMVPVFKFLAIIATYVGQVLAVLGGIIMHIGGAIAQAIGGLIVGIGKVVSKIPGLGGLGRDIANFGRGIRDTGKSMRGMGNAMFEAAGELAEARDKIRGMSTEDALEGLGDAAADVTEELLNVPEGFKVALAAFTAATPTALVSPVSAGVAAGVYGGVSAQVSPSVVRERPVLHKTVNNNITAQIQASDPERQWKEIKRVIEREGAAGAADVGPRRVAS